MRCLTRQRAHAASRAARCVTDTLPNCRPQCTNAKVPVNEGRLARPGSDFVPKLLGQANCGSAIRPANVGARADDLRSTHRTARVSTDLILWMVLPFHFNAPSQVDDHATHAERRCERISACSSPGGKSRGDSCAISLQPRGSGAP